VRHSCILIEQFILLRGSVINNTICLERCYILMNETTCFGLQWPPSGFHKQLRRVYILCEGVLMKRFLRINPLFALVSSVNRLYIRNEEVFSISSVEIEITVLGLHEF
jgi:hypothetical protein